MQSIILDVQFSSKEMCSITESDVRKRLAFIDQSLFNHFEQCYKDCVDFGIQTLNAIKAIQWVVNTSLND